MIVQSHPSGADAWLVVAGPTTVLALPASESERVAEFTAQLGGPEAFRATLESLVADGIANAPSFAILDGDTEVLRAVLRGGAAVSANVAGDAVAFSGNGMATWTERVLEGVRSLRLTVPGSAWTVVLDTGANPLAAAPSENTLVPRVDIDVPAREPSVLERAGASVTQRDASPVESSDPGESAYDFLFGDTIYRTQAGASIRIPNPDPERPGDHDGQTMLADDLGLVGHVSAMVAASEATVLSPISPRSPTDPLVSAEPAPSLPLAPALQLERADGSREPLSRPVLIGRSPVAPGSGSDVRLITVLDDPDISRSHLRVAVEGDAVVVTDLGSKNGTVVTLPGAIPRKLRASEPAVVLPGTLIDLGGGTVFTVRED